MIRKSLFWGLTLILVVAIVNLALRGRRLEKARARQMVEVVQESKPTATRALSPQDLEIMQLKTSIDSQSHTARHEMEIRNIGMIPYSEIRVEFTYRNRQGRILGTKSYSVPQPVLPGTAATIANILIDQVPASAFDSTISITSAAMGEAKTSQVPGD